MGSLLPLWQESIANLVLWEVLKPSKGDIDTPEAKVAAEWEKSVSVQILNSQSFCYTKNPSPMQGNRKPSQATKQMYVG